MRYIKDKWRDFIFIIFLISIVWLLFFLLNKIESLHHTVEQLLDRNYVLLDKNYALESSIKKLYSSQLEKFDINQLENYNDTLCSSLKERVGTGITNTSC